VSDASIRVLRLINGLQQGGAEESLRKLLVATRQTDAESLVVSLGSDGALRAEIERTGASVIEMGLTRIPSPIKLLTMMRLVRAWKPDVIEGWMVHANVLALLLRWARPRARVIWNVRTSLALSAERPLTRVLTRLGVVLSRRVEAIVYNSEVSARQHEAIGYSADRTHVIPNGFDTDEFRVARDRQVAARSRWGLPPSAKIIGHVGRWHADKDHATLLAAFARVKVGRPDCVLVMAGAGLDRLNAALMSEIDRHQLRDAVVLLGSVRSPSELYPAFDAFALTSIREGIPNVLGEALACGVPCVSTDVGGCREIIGASAVFPVGDAGALADALTALIDEPEPERARRAAEGRRRIVESFSLGAYGRRYLALYESVIAPRTPRRGSLPTATTNVRWRA
jgi:glycosyltransferase involved in cell wall biosynthesis